MVFPLFFLLFYGLVNWGLILTLQENLNYAAQAAARATLSVDVQDPNHPTTMQQLARQTANTTLAWLPDTWKARVLGASGEKVEVALVNEDGADWLQVRIRYANYSSDPLLPLITVPGVGSFPPVPDQLLGQAALRW